MIICTRCAGDEESLALIAAKEKFRFNLRKCFMIGKTKWSTEFPSFLGSKARLSSHSSGAPQESLILHGSFEAGSPQLCGASFEAHVQA